MTDSHNARPARRGDPVRRWRGRALGKKPYGNPIAVFRSLAPYLDPNCARDLWLRILMGCKAGDDSEAMRQECLNWSAPGATFKERDFNTAWNSIRPDGGITFGTVVRIAREAGWLGMDACSIKPLSRPVAAGSTLKPKHPSPEVKIYDWTPPGNPEAIYYYNRPDGSPLYRKVRYKTATGKSTPFQYYEPARDVWIGYKGCMEGVERALYRNEQFSGFQQIVVVEGEKCADALWDLGVMATTADAGARSWKTEYAEVLRGKDVAIIPDNDEPGRAYAQKVANSLVDVARSIKIVKLPGLGPKEDVYDWLLSNGESL